MYLYFKYTRKDQYLYLYLYFTGRKAFVFVFQILMYAFDPKSDQIMGLINAASNFLPSVSLPLLPLPLTLSFSSFLLSSPPPSG